MQFGETFGFPLWTFDRGGGSVPTIGCAGYDTMMPAIFTDREAASKFLEAANMPDATPLQINSPAFLMSMLEHFKKVGLKYVAFDLRQDVGTVVPINEFIASIRTSE